MKFLKQFPNEPYDEAALIRTYRLSGDLNVLGRIYQPYMEQLFLVCYRYFRSEEDARDAVMELFEKLSCELKSHEPVHFRAWLYSVARNYCLMKLRRNEAAGNAVHPGRAEHHETEEEAFSVSDAQLDLLTHCIGQLPEHQQRAVELFYLKEMCYRQIAGVTGFSMQRIKSYLQNGKRNLKNCLEKNGRA
ncbi:MAG: hypothetical protein ABS46_04295 [Cytophagaceae bacterium SCN 52-12]|nr:MAG: hypothetical protein ABS46_04295 [Cytophagaceae bacterium SCN 52-12]